MHGLVQIIIVMGSNTADVNSQRNQAWYCQWTDRVFYWGDFSCRFWVSIAFAN